MTPHWHDGPLATLRWDGVSPVVWRGQDADARQASARALIAHLAGVRENDVAIDRAAAGAPVVAYPPGWRVGLSRRGDRCLIGAATQPIAVDRELVDDEPPLWDMLTDDEARALRGLDAVVRPRAWLRRWTIKEAHAKLVGEPRRLVPETIATRVIDAVQAVAQCEGTSRCWTYDDGHAIQTVALWS